MKSREHTDLTVMFLRLEEDDDLQHPEVDADEEDLVRRPLTLLWFSP